MKKILTILAFAAAILTVQLNSYLAAQTLWETAKKNKDVLTISTLFIAQDVRDYLSSPDGLDNAVKWCKETGITRVFIETFRGGYYAEKDALIKARDRFIKEGFGVAGCVTTVSVGKAGIGGWGVTSCYTNKATLDEMDRIFKLTASIFDLIMIDDFLFTECGCEDCIAAKGDQSWAKFRCDLMVDMSRNHILKPAREINPKVKIIIKYPLWFDNFHEKGYEVIRESKDFDYTWIGTETRDYNYDAKPDSKSEGEAQYNAYFISRWINVVSMGKNGGGWIDALGTTPKFYVEQARQTVLGNEREIMLFHYGSLQDEVNYYDGKPGTPIADVKALKAEIPQLFELAGIVKDKPLRGIHIPKIPNSDGLEEKYVFSFIGMLGLPLVPDDHIDTSAPSAIFTVHSLKESGFSGKLKSMLDAGKPVVITDGLARLLSDQTLLQNKNLSILNVESAPRKLLKMNYEDLKPLRDKLLAPLGIKFDAPNMVGLYLAGSNYIVIENFNNVSINATVEMKALSVVTRSLLIPQDSEAAVSRDKNTIRINNLSPRALIVLEYK
jgi:hypothetical protein